jgi:hypothetical protein
MTVRRRSMVLLPAAVLALVLANHLQAAEPPAEAKQAGLAPQFLRLVDEGAAGGKLETADVTYKRADGTTVTLISAVHIGEKSYFDGLNDSFKKYDAVLFELVKPKDGPVPGGVPGAVPENREPSVVGDVQRMMKDTLNLTFQLDVVDYTAKNFVHADLDAEEFERMQREKGQTFPELMMKALMRAMTEPEQGAKGLPLAGVDDPDQLVQSLIRTFTRPDSERQLKLILARQMTSIEGESALLGGDNSVILHDRNKAALKVLEQTLNDPAKKQIAIFYGAAHMPDLETHLSEMGFTKAATEWRTAWDLRIRADQPSAIEQFLTEGVQSLLDEAERQ